MLKRTHENKPGFIDLRAALQSRRAAARGRREIESVLAGNHGKTVRNELLAMLEAG